MHDLCQDCMKTVIEVDNLVKVYNGKTSIVAVDGISFSIGRGRIFSFLGPNGAGKTTTVRVLSCLLKPTAGDAWVLGNSVKDNQVAIRENIGMLSENHGLYEKMSLEDNLKFFAGFYLDDKSTIEGRMADLLEEFNLSNRRHDKVGTLSRGLKQRASLIKTLIHDPAVLFLDEPTAGLDPKAAVELRKYITHLRDKMDKTIFMCTHNLVEAQTLSDVAAIIDKGKIMRMGSPGELERDLFQSNSLRIESTSDIPVEIPRQIARELDITGRSEGKHARFFLPPGELDNLVPLIVKSLVEGGIPILEVEREGHTLEDIYLELMEREGNA